MGEIDEFNTRSAFSVEEDEREMLSIVTTPVKNVMSVISMVTDAAGSTCCSA